MFGNLLFKNTQDHIFNIKKYLMSDVVLRNLQQKGGDRLKIEVNITTDTL
jgi:hypothetical protein